MPSGVSLCLKNLQPVDLNCTFLEFKDRLFSLAVLHSIRTVPPCVSCSTMYYNVICDTKYSRYKSNHFIQSVLENIPRDFKTKWHP